MFNITMMIQRSGQWACQLSCDFFILTYSDCSSIFFIHAIKNCPSGKSSSSESSVEVLSRSMAFYACIPPHPSPCDSHSPLPADSSLPYLFQLYWTPHFPPALENHPALKTLCFLFLSLVFVFSQKFTHHNLRCYLS